jgi:hypothetical protein
MYTRLNVLVKDLNALRLSMLQGGSWVFFPLRSMAILSLCFTKVISLPQHR